VSLANAGRLFRGAIEYGSMVLLVSHEWLQMMLLVRDGWLRMVLLVPHGWLGIIVLEIGWFVWPGDWCLLKSPVSPHIWPSFSFTNGVQTKGRNTIGVIYAFLGL
jgi:hypothetical protein